MNVDDDQAGRLLALDRAGDQLVVQRDALAVAAGHHQAAGIVAHGSQPLIVTVRTVLQLRGARQQGERLSCMPLHHQGGADQLRREHQELVVAQRLSYGQHALVVGDRLA